MEEDEFDIFEDDEDYDPYPASSSINEILDEGFGATWDEMLDELDIEEVVKELAATQVALNNVAEQRDALAERIDSYRELMQEMADRYIDEMHARKKLERDLEEAYAYLLGVRCAVRDTETGAVSLVKVPVQMPEGGAFV